jgi:hypothetical protein
MNLFLFIIKISLIIKLICDISILNNYIYLTFLFIYNIIENFNNNTLNFLF